ncbi:ATP-grasp domain-containing protein [Streptomyces sp. NPDC015661]|uniref:ATP-grasp domain-containing protein n=1 Tax=Streptomyces sp. NPDC015661 TaxID=3364961 RepID=UPI0037034F4B
MPRIALIGGNARPITTAHELGVDVVLVHEEGRYEPDFADYCSQILHAPIGDSAAILKVLGPLHAEEPFDAVLSATEYAAIAAGEVADALGVPGTTARTARALKDKAETRRLLDEHDLSPIRHAMVASEQETADFAESVGGRIVVKPADGVASLHVHVVESREDAATAFKHLREAGYTRAIAEEYLEGPVVSVDTFSHRGRHVVFGMSEYQMNDRFVEWEVSTPSRVAAPHRAELTELVGRLLDVVGLTDGPAHSEFVLTPNGPKVLESHDRFAGSGAPELVRRACGVDLYRMFLAVQLGFEELPQTSPVNDHGAAIRFFTPQPGTLKEITGLDTVDALVLTVPPGEAKGNIVPLLSRTREAEVVVVITRHPGDTLPELRSVKDCSSGYVIATGKDADEATAICERVVSQISFHVE